MKKYILFILAAMLVAPIHAKKRSDIEEKKIEQIWARADMGEFNNRTVSDKYKNEPAVVLAQYHELSTRREEAESDDMISPSSKFVVFTVLDRYMVKINSTSAIRQFSTIRYEKNSSDDVVAVGIRVYKPNGKVVEVNPDDYIKMGTDLKSRGEKENVVKIAVPNLQKGDVIDYFMYQESSIYEKLKDETLNCSYPIQSYRFRGVFAKRSRFHYWLPNSIQPQVSNENNMNTMTFKVTDIEPLKREIFSSKVGRGVRFRYDFKKWPFNYIVSSKDYGIKSLQRVEEPLPIQSASYAKAPLAGNLKQWFKQIKTYLKNHPELSEKEKLEVVYYQLADFVTPQEEIHSYFEWYYLIFLQKLKIQVDMVSVADRNKVQNDDAVRKEDFCTVAKWGDSTILHLYDSGLRSLWDYTNNIEGSVMKTVNKQDWETVPETPAEKNRIDVVADVAINKEDGLSLDVKRSVTISGNVKKPYRNLLGTYVQWDSIVRERYGLPYGLDVQAKGMDKTTPRIVSKKRLQVEREALRQEETFEQEAKGYFNGKIRKLNRYHIDSYGLFLNDLDFRYKSDVVLESAVQTSDKRKVIHIGHLLCYMDLSDLREERLSDIVLRNAFHDTYQINFQIPAGYQVWNKEAFERNISNACGSLVSTAKVEGDNLIVNVAWRINGLKFPASDWKNVLEILRGYQSLYNTSAVLTLR